MPTDLWTTMDGWIETTMNKGLKMKAGCREFLKILKNETKLCTHVHNGNYVNQLCMSLYIFLKIKRYDSGHAYKIKVR